MVIFLALGISLYALSRLSLGIVVPKHKSEGRGRTEKSDTLHV